jgi:hypothetical protein
MPKCENCGKKFDADEARSEFDAVDEWAGELTYDEDIVDPHDEGIEEHSICGSCAIAVTVENLGAGRAMQFSLETGLPPEDVPDDWSPSADGGVTP